LVYLKPERFVEEGIEIGWMDYSGYPEYPQLWGGFEPRVSIIDLLLNRGAEAAHWAGSSAPDDEEADPRRVPRDLMSERTE
jgi:hypothetical protein